MRLKLFRARGMAEAMTAIRLELGPDALILSSRRVAGGIEVTAALGDVALPVPARAHSDRSTQSVLAFHGVPPALSERLEDGDLAQNLKATLVFRPLALASGDTPVLFAGPPGAGKTLTVARLATRLVMRDVKPLVITADGQRAGAAEQLAAFTRLLGIELVVASHPASLARALKRRTEDAPVLIDLPGGCAFDASYLDAVCAMGAVAGGRVAAVLPAGMDVQETSETATAYHEAGARSLIVTRLDVVRRIGGVLAASVTGLALAELGIGPNAADGLVPATADTLAARLQDVRLQGEDRG